MAKILKIYKDTDPQLREVCVPVQKINQYVKDLSASMELTMDLAGGIGLAANQVGEVLRMIWVKGPEFSGVMINPIIEELSTTEALINEACLSLPGVEDVVTSRSQEISVSYKDLDGNEKNVLLTGLTAVIVQHEVDHLNGILLSDYFEEES